MYSPAFKCWAVIVSFCLAAFPLYAQVHNAAQRTADGIEPAQLYLLAAHAPTQEPDPNTEPEPGSPDSETLVIEDTVSNSQVSHYAEHETGLEEPDQALSMEDYLQGIIDGKKATRGKPLWILAGLSGTGLCICFGVAGIGVALAVPYYPPPPAEMLIGKSSKYIEGYYEGYTAKSRWKNAGWATIGCLLAVLIDIALNFPMSFGNFHVDMDND